MGSMDKVRLFEVEARKVFRGAEVKVNPKGNRQGITSIELQVTYPTVLLDEHKHFKMPTMELIRTLKAAGHILTVVSHKRCTLKVSTPASAREQALYWKANAPKKGYHNSMNLEVIIRGL